MDANKYGLHLRIPFGSDGWENTLVRREDLNFWSQQRNNSVSGLV